MTQKILQKQSYKPGDLILRKGEIGKHALFIESGLVEAFHEHPDGSTSTLGRIGQNSIIGEMALLGGEDVRCASVRALAPTTVVVIEEYDLRKLFRPDDKVLRAVIEIMAERLKRVNTNYSGQNGDMLYVLHELLPKLEYMMTSEVSNKKSYLHSEIEPALAHLRDCLRKYQIDDLQVDDIIAPSPLAPEKASQTKDGA